MSEVRYMPLPRPLPIWPGDAGGYPPIMKVSFMTGRVLPYAYMSAITQPKPQTISRKELNRLHRENPDGYRPRHEKK